MVVRISIGSPVLGFNAAIQAVAGSYAIGDVLLVFIGEHMGADTITVPAGWTDVGDVTTCPQSRVFGIVATSSSVAIPSIKFGADRSFCYAAAYRGLTLSPAFAAVGRTTNGLQNIPGPAVSRTPSANGAAVFFCGNRNKTAATNGNTYSAPTNFTLVQQHAQNGVSTSSVMCEWLQGTATIIPANQSAAGALAETVTQANQGQFFALLAAVTPGPVYTADPTLSTLAATSASFNQTLDSDSTAYAVAVTHGDSAPTATQIKAGQNAAGTAAFSAAVGSALATTPKSLTLTGLTAATAYDFYFVGNNVNGDTVVKSVLNQTTPVIGALVATLTAATRDGYTLSFTPTGSGTVYVVACKKGSGIPANNLVRTGTPAGFISRFSVTATNGIPGTLTLTGLTLPKADLHAIVNVTGVDSAVTSFLDRLKLPATGRQYSSFGVLAASSPFLAASITPALAAGDVLDIVLHSPSGYLITPTSGGDLLINAGGDESRELLGWNAYDDSVAAMYYLADSTVAINNLPPVPSNPSSPFTYFFAKNAVISQDLSAIMQDPETDPVQYSEVSAVLAGLGLSVSNQTLSGPTPNAFSITDVTLRGADPYLGFTDVVGRVVIGQTQIPNYSGIQETVYEDDLGDANLLVGSVSWVDSVLPVGQVASTNPSYPAFVNPDTPVDIQASGAEVPDLLGFSYADGLLLAAAQGLQMTGGPFAGFILAQTPLPNAIVAPGSLIVVSPSGSRYYGVDIQGMQPSDVSVGTSDLQLTIQIVLDLTRGMSRIEILQCLEALRNYIKSRKFP